MIKVSIILPVRNEALHIKGCLESIFSQSAVFLAEVIVVDGMSNDGTRKALYKLQNKHPSLIILDNPEKRVTTAVNIGVKAARGGIIMRLDAHALYSRDYLVTCLQVMEESGAANVGGHAFALPSGPTAMAHAIAFAHHSAFGLGGADFRNIDAGGFVETVWPGCFKKEVFEKVGLLTEELERSEDIEFNYRLRKAGYTIFLSPKIKVWYFCRATLGALWQQRFLDGKGVMETLRVNAGAVRARHFVPLAVTLVCLSALVRFLISVFLNSSAMVRSSLIIMIAGACLYCGGSLFYSCASLARLPEINGRVPETRDDSYKIKKGSALLLPIVFAVLHFSYGIGSIAGLMSLCKAPVEK
jgi:GT2 family glycosyltransferase